MRLIRTVRISILVTGLAALLGVACGGSSASNSGSTSNGSVGGGAAVGGPGANSGGATVGDPGAGGAASPADSAASGGVAATQGQTPSTGGVAAVGVAGSSSGPRANAGEGCTSIGERACADSGTEAILFCASNRTWQVVERCSTGATCAGSPVSCVVNSSICSGGAGTYCADETALAQCDANGRIVKRSICPSVKCSKNVCSKWDPCNWADARVMYQLLCDFACDGQEYGCVGSETEKIAVGVNLSYLYFQAQDTKPTYDVAIPAAARWWILDACPEVRTYILRTDSKTIGSPVYTTFELPEQYWVVSTTVQVRPEYLADYAKARELACTATPDVVPYRIDFKPDSIAIIATRDPKAPAFMLSLRALWNEPTP